MNCGKKYFEYDETNPTHRDAKALRQYLLSTEMKNALDTIPPTHALNTITVEFVFQLKRSGSMQHALGRQHPIHGEIQLTITEQTLKAQKA